MNESRKILGQTPLPGGGGAEIQSRILFDMRLGPVTPAVDVNVNPAE
jgi:hypothetical protein